ncbi:MAG: aminoglycoside phosphotransferase [Alphaproteobacteria bacterium]|nr:aminoglycoside phosphotransferase [Alphaproteobacteria bacterium]
MSDTPMPDRTAPIARFLAPIGWGSAIRQPLAGDASFRRYHRLSLNGRRAVLMDAPPDHEDVRPFVKVCRHLLAGGFSAPEILAVDPDAGFVLLEDLGDDLFTRILPGKADEAALYRTAIDVLIALHGDPRPLDVPPYDTARYLAEADLLLDWFLPEVAGAPTPAPTKNAWHAALREVLPLVERVPGRVVLRDFHADNLLWLPERAGIKRCGLLDFQDALIGPSAYDLVSLLEDARRDVSPATVAMALDRYLAAMGGGDQAAFRAAYAVLGAQRNSKIVGIFARLFRRDGKPAYLDLIPRVWNHLAEDLRHPALAPVRAWFDAHVPPAWRRRP